MSFKLRIWLQDEPLSPDAPDTVTYADVELRTDLPLPALRGLVDDLARHANEVVNEAAELRRLAR